MTIQLERIDVEEQTFLAGEKGHIAQHRNRRIQGMRADHPIQHGKDRMRRRLVENSVRQGHLIDSGILLRFDLAEIPKRQLHSPAEAKLKRDRRGPSMRPVGR